VWFLWLCFQNAENQNGALDDPEHGDAADCVGRDEFDPARKWNADAGRHMPRIDFGRNTPAKTLRLAKVAYPEKDYRAPRCVWRIKTEWGDALPSAQAAYWSREHRPRECRGVEEFQITFAT